MERFGFEYQGGDFIGYYRLIDGGIEVTVNGEKRFARLYPSSSPRWLMKRLAREIIAGRRLVVLQERAEADDDASCIMGDDTIF